MRHPASQHCPHLFNASEIDNSRIKSFPLKKLSPTHTVMLYRADKSNNNKGAPMNDDDKYVAGVSDIKA